MIGKFILNVVEVAAGIAVFEGVKHIADPVKRAELQVKLAQAKLKAVQAKKAKAEQPTECGA